MYFAGQPLQLRLQFSLENLTFSPLGLIKRAIWPQTLLQYQDVNLVQSHLGIIVVCFTLHWGNCWYTPSLSQQVTARQILHCHD